MLSVTVLGDFIGGKFVRPPGARHKIVSRDPGDVGYRIGAFPTYPEHVSQAVAAAVAAQPSWAALEPADRANWLRKFAAEVVNRRRELRDTIAAETGKPLYDSEEEVAEMEAQAEIEIREGVRMVNPFRVSEIRHGVTGSCRFRPLGVIAVLGAAVSPLSLSCAHILPALLAGNSVVFKPSKLVPACGQRLARMFDHIEIPPGVFNLVQGDAAAGSALAAHPEVAGVLFSGSYPTGRRILEATLSQPHKLVALHMGGLNVALVLEDADLDRAIYETVCGAFLSAGQRHTSTRLVIVAEAVFERFAQAFVQTVSRLEVGYAFDPGVFLGPLLSESARDRALDMQERLGALGVKTLLRAEPRTLSRRGYYLSPGVYLLERGPERERFQPDGLFFGPQVALLPAATDEEALQLANRTQSGFAAAVFTRDGRRFEEIAAQLRYGVINHNLGTADVSMRLPLAGAGRCGNHRPGGIFNQRNCTQPVASLLSGAGAEREARRRPFPR